MKTREWILLILLLSVVQAFIWFLSHTYSGSNNALGYVSFAGTIISIILAVVAIIYNFTESVGQKNKSDLISIQIEKLRDVVANIDIKSDSLNVISEISQELSTFKESFDKRICETNERILSLQDFGMYLKQTGTIDLDKTKLVDALLKSRSPLYEISLLMICSLNKMKINPESKINNFREIVETPIDKANNKFSKDASLKKQIFPGAIGLFTGSTIILYAVLLNLGLVKENDNNEYEISLELFSIIEKLKDNWSNCSLYYEDIRKNIIVNK